MAHLYILHFGNHGDLSRAFDRVLASPDVDSCVVESESSRLRFFGAEAPAEKLVELIYQEGGLVWCSRHRLSELPAGSS